MSSEALAAAVGDARGAHARMVAHLAELMAGSGLQLRRAVLDDGGHDLVLFLDYADAGSEESVQAGPGGGEPGQVPPPWGAGGDTAADPTFAALPVRRAADVEPSLEHFFEACDPRLRVNPGSGSLSEASVPLHELVRLMAVAAVGDVLLDARQKDRRPPEAAAFPAEALEAARGLFNERVELLGGAPGDAFDVAVASLRGVLWVPAEQLFPPITGG